MSVFNFLDDVAGFIADTTFIGPLINSVVAPEVDANNAAARLETQRVRTQSLSDEYKRTKGRIASMDRLQKQLEYNEAVNYNRGLRASSPSFNAIQASQFNSGARILSNSVLAQHLNKLSAQSEIYSINAMRKLRNEQAYWRGLGQVVQLGVAAGGLLV